MNLMMLKRINVNIENISSSIYDEHRLLYRPISTVAKWLLRIPTKMEAKGICLCKQENACGGLFQNHRYTPQYSTKTEADPS